MCVEVSLHSHRLSLAPSKKRSRVHALTGQYLRYARSASLLWWMQQDDTSIDVYSQQVNSTCFGHHYAHRQENRPYKTACAVSLDVLAAVVWSRDPS